MFDGPASNKLLDSREKRASLAELQDFTVGATEGFALKPYEGVRQMAQKAGAELPQVKLSSETERNSWSYTAGAFVGTVAEFWVLNRFAGAALRRTTVPALVTTKQEAAQMGLTGATMGLLAPIGSNSENFLADKVKNIAKDSLSFAAFGASLGAMNQFAVWGRPGQRTLLADGTINALSGGTAGLTELSVRAIAGIGSPIGMSDVGVTLAGSAAFGIGFAGLSRALSPNASIKLSQTESANKQVGMSTEKWASELYDGSTAIRSPIFTWIAETKPKLRPENFDKLRESAWKEVDPTHLSLSDWSASKRPEIIKELRRLSKTDLSKDSNLDSFIDRFHSEKVNNASKQYLEKLDPQIRLREEVEQALNSNPLFKEARSLFQVQTDPKFSAHLDDALKQKLNQLSEYERKPLALMEERSLNNALQEQMNVMTKEVGVPALKITATPQEGAQHFLGNVDIGMKTPSKNMSGEVLEKILHEFDHHRQGLLYDSSTLSYSAVYTVKQIGRMLGMNIERSAKQNPTNSREFLMEYVGSKSEREAYALGVLARIRAVSREIPER